MDRQMRLDYEAAEVSYRAFRKEYLRVLSVGGANAPTEVMKRTASGPYLADFTRAVQAYKKGHYVQRGGESIVFVKRVGYDDASLLLDTCEDGRKHATYDDRGKLVGRGEIRTARIEVRKSNGVWKLWSADGVKVSSCP